MKIRNKLVWKIGGLALATSARLWMKTLDFQAAYYDPTIDPPREDYQGPVIFALWHDQILFPFYLRGHTNTAVLMSQHADAQWLNEGARHLGFEVVRGSTNRGGLKALREIMGRCKGMNLAVTPDGPRGPRRKLAPGIIYLSSKLQVPIVCSGSAYQRPWRLSTWDRFAIPKPFTRSRAVVSPRMQIPADLARGEVEVYRQQVEDMLNFCTTAAQTWADEGGRYAGQVPVCKGTVRRMPFGSKSNDATSHDIEIGTAKFIHSKAA